MRYMVGVSLIALTGCGSTPYLEGNAGFTRPASYVEAEGTGLDRIGFRDDRGLTFGGAVGTEWDNGFAVELEGSTAGQEFSWFQPHTSRRSPRNVGGYLRGYEGNLNARYTHRQDEWIIHPYFQVGVGLAFADVELGLPLSDSSSHDKIRERARGRSTLFPTYNAAVGLELPLSSSVSVFSELRYSGSFGSANVNGGEGSAACGNDCNGSQWEYYPQTSTMFGLRYNFDWN